GAGDRGRPIAHPTRPARDRKGRGRSDRAADLLASPDRVGGRAEPDHHRCLSRAAQAGPAPAGRVGGVRRLCACGSPRTRDHGHLSEEQFGRELSDLLVADGASLELATVGPEPTTIAVADVDSQGFAEYQFLVKGTSAPNLTMEMLPAEFARDVSALHVGTLGLVLEPMASTIVELVQRERDGRLIMLDPNIRIGLTDDFDYRDRLN